MLRAFLLGVMSWGCWPRTLGRFKISFWRTNHGRISGGTNSPYYRHCVGIVNTSHPTNLLVVLGRWCPRRVVNPHHFQLVNAAVAEVLSPKLQFLEHFNYDIPWDLPPPRNASHHQDFSNNFFRHRKSNKKPTVTFHTSFGTSGHLKTYGSNFMIRTTCGC